MLRKSPDACSVSSRFSDEAGGRGRSDAPFVVFCVQRSLSYTPGDRLVACRGANSLAPAFNLSRHCLELVVWSTPQSKSYESVSCLDHAPASFAVSLESISPGPSCIALTAGSKYGRSWGSRVRPSGTHERQLQRGEGYSSRGERTEFTVPGGGFQPLM